MKLAALALAATLLLTGSVVPPAEQTFQECYLSMHAQLGQALGNDYLIEKSDEATKIAIAGCRHLMTPGKPELITQASK